MFKGATFDDARDVVLLRPIFREGDTVKTMRNRLRRAGVTGSIGSKQRCPLANCLKTAYPGLRIKVDGYKVEIGEAVINTQHSPIFEFVTNFDRGDYPELKGSK